jgi:hypothetical protein
MRARTEPYVPPASAGVEAVAGQARKPRAEGGLTAIFCFIEAGDSGKMTGTFDRFR